MRYIVITAILMCIVMVLSCVNDSDEDQTQYEYERTLSREQLNEEVDQVKIEDSRMFCLVMCGALVVPRDEADKQSWSDVSLCRIDLCHSTEMCTNGCDGLRDRLKACPNADKDSL